jgi:hypothetical protein
MTSVKMEGAIRASWSRESCDPVDLADWSRDNPARGQCGVTALVVQDLLGGELLLAEVHHADGRRQGVHYWNRIGGVEIDLTREQFRDGEVIGPPRVIERPPGPVSGRLAAQYRALSAAVRARYAAAR